MTVERTKTGALPKLGPLGVTIYVISAFFIAVAQSSLYRGFSFFGTLPALGLCFSCAAGYFDGEKTGGAVGLLTGFLVDALGNTSFSLLPLAYALVGYFVGVFGTAGRGLSPLKACFASFCVRLGAAVGVGAIVTLFGILVLSSSPNFLHALVFVTLPEALISYVFGLLFWVAYRIIYRKRAKA